MIIEPQKLLDFLKSRRSIRNFKDKSISEKDITMILEAAQWTPSASNKQPWRFIVIKDKDLLKKISGTAVYGKFLKNAPLAIAIIGKKTENPNWYIQDATLASMSMMLMAWSLDIGTCWIGTMDREKVKNFLSLSEEDYLLTVLPMGYIKGEVPKPTLRKNLDEITGEIS